MKLIVGIADMKVSKDPGITLITFSLGSCIGVSLYDPSVKVGGLLHFMLPDSTIDPQKAQKNPWMFADSGIPLFFKEAYRLGAEKKRLEVKVVGGAQILDDSRFFNIGKKNYMALRKIFWANQVLISAEEVGGNVHRTFSLELSSGKTWVKIAGRPRREL